mgnify:CR=1 FL=1
MLNRRQLLGAGAAGATLVSSKAWGQTLNMGLPEAAQMDSAATAITARPNSGPDYTPVVTLNGWTLPHRMNNGVKEFHLVAEPVERELADGMIAHLWGYNGQSTGPTIEAVEGDRVRIFVTNKLGGQSLLEAQMGRGLSQAKKGTTNRQGVLNVLNSVAESIHRKQLQMRQVIQVLDINGTGFMSRAEFSQVVRGLCESISLEQTRLLLAFFDERSSGKIAVPELVALLQDLIKAKPSSAKGQYLQTISLSSTMGVGVVIDQSTLTLK